MKLLTSLYLIF
jgi:hypothetical protein